MLAVLIGTVAAAIGSIQFIPQVAHTIRQRRNPEALSGVSLPAFAMLAVSTGLWLTYGILKRDLIIMAPNILAVCGAVTILGVVARARYVRAPEDSHEATTTVSGDGTTEA